MIMMLVWNAIKNPKKLVIYIPQEYPKAPAKIQMKTTATHPAALWLPMLSLYPPKIPATTKWQSPITKAPEIKSGFRPTLSTHITAGIVHKNITIPTTPDASKEVVFPDKPNEANINGA